MRKNRDNDFADCSYRDIIDLAKRPEAFKLERTELYALTKELAFRLKILKDVVNRF